MNASLGTPFSHKHKPLHLADVVSNPTICDRLIGYVGQSYVPHMLFVGETGTGKNTIAECFIRDYLGDNYDNRHFYCLNGSICRKRDHISSDKAGDRDLKSFIKISINPVQRRRRRFNGEATKSSERTICRKLILIRDFHCMTEDAQTALRTLMEQYAKTVSFILTCNNQDDIVEAIQSRATPMVFTHTDKSTLMKLLSRVAQDEQYVVNNQLLEYLCELSDGKIGVALNHLQLCNGLTADEAAQMFDINVRRQLTNIINMARTAQLNDTVKCLTKLCTVHGYQPIELCNLMLHVIQLTDQLDSTEKFTLLCRISDLTLTVMEDESPIYLVQLVCLIKTAVARG